MISVVRSLSQPQMVDLFSTFGRDIDTNGLSKAVQPVSQLFQTLFGKVTIGGAYEIEAILRSTGFARNHALMDSLLVHFHNILNSLKADVMQRLAIYDEPRATLSLPSLQRQYIATRTKAVASAPKQLNWFVCSQVGHLAKDCPKVRK